MGPLGRVLGLPPNNYLALGTIFDGHRSVCHLTGIGLFSLRPPWRGASTWSVYSKQ